MDKQSKCLPAALTAGCGPTIFHATGCRLSSTVMLFAWTDSNDGWEREKMRVNAMRGSMIWGSGLAMLLLAGCGEKTVTAQNASVAEVAEKVKKADLAQESFVSPGKWQLRMTIQDMSIPGMPPEMAQHMKSAMGQGRAFESCVTPEDAKRPKEKFFAGADAPNCRYDNFTMGGGKVSLLMHCDGEGGKRTMKMDGTYGADAYHMTMASTGQVEGGTMTMTATMDGKRVGACTGKEAS